MNSADYSLRKTKNDIEKLEKQIQSVLRGLLNDGILVSDMMFRNCNSAFSLYET